MECFYKQDYAPVFPETTLTSFCQASKTHFLKPENHIYEVFWVRVKQQGELSTTMTWWVSGCGSQPCCDTHSNLSSSLFFQKSKEEKKKKKKHKHEEKEEDLLGGQADEPAVHSEENNEVAAPPTSTSAEVQHCKRVEWSFFLSSKEYQSEIWLTQNSS